MSNFDYKQVYQQLGGRRFAAMTGAHTFVAGSNFLSLKFKGSKAANYLKVVYNDVLDLYEMTFGKIRGNDYKIIGQFEQVYGDDMQRIFTDVTGLYTSL